MGAGIAQLALEAGQIVGIHDVDLAAIDRGRSRIRSGLGRRARRLDLDARAADAWVDERIERLFDALTLDELADAAPALVIEAALEDLEAKRSIFEALDRTTSADTILATNTSALSVAAIADRTARPGRVLGLHFFNPAPVMPLVEVVSGPATDPTVADLAARLVTTWGKVPVHCSDTPGFIVNRVNRPFTLEALTILSSGGGSVEAIDRALRSAGFPMGPFELMDLVGLDINLAAARGLFERTVASGDPLANRFRPSPIQEHLVATGRLGRKSRAGFYRYDEADQLIGPAPDSHRGGWRRRTSSRRDRRRWPIARRADHPGHRQRGVSGRRERRRIRRRHRSRDAARCRAPHRPVRACRAARRACRRPGPAPGVRERGPAVHARPRATRGGVTPLPSVA